MSFFKFRKGGDDQPATAAQSESVEVMRRRARHRLIGAVVLVVIAVIGFPLLFDTQPRPIPVDIPIDIPDKNKVKPLTMPGSPVASGTVVAASSAVAQIAPAPAPKSAPASAPAPAPAQPATPPPAAAAAVTAPAPKAAAPSNGLGPKEEIVASGAASKATASSAKAAPSAPAAEARFVVQVGAFADAGKAREARAKLERAGLKTYTHVADTPDGKRTRVRLGPFSTRAEADKAAAQAKGLGLPANILTL
ncbi:MAG: SPOR domain-containing protein [Burkholderiaceae bacterium]|nr:SPOR domain-containing protein [Burkholderiaceae bacterium]MDO9089080.1 SPOR domain-containing protein [Burkholderiaceae bacterium]MDP1967674.1 SPOR domain-containing protein [Burkholderiaceae bacterium]